MKIRVFVTGSALMLGAWLAVTFVSSVPVERYPQYGKGSVPVSAHQQKAPTEKRVASLPGAEKLPVAVVD